MNNRFYRLLESREKLLPENQRWKGPVEPTLADFKKRLKARRKQAGEVY